MEADFSGNRSLEMCLVDRGLVCKWVTIACDLN